jgi:hypothetical protein
MLKKRGIQQLILLFQHHPYHLYPDHPDSDSLTLHHLTTTFPLNTTPPAPSNRYQYTPLPTPEQSQAIELLLVNLLRCATLFPAELYIDNTPLTGPPEEKTTREPLTDAIIWLSPLARLLFTTPHPENVKDHHKHENQYPPVKGHGKEYGQEENPHSDNTVGQNVFPILEVCNNRFQGSSHIQLR